MNASQELLEIGSSEDWQSAVCVPLVGSGTLARIGNVIVLVAEADDREVAPLIDHAAMVAANGSDGRQLVRGLALQLASMAGDPPPFVALAPVPAGLAVFASGEAAAIVDSEEVTGRSSLAWAERVFPWPITKVAASVGETSTPGSTLLDLQQGVVGGAGFTMGRRTDDRVAEASQVDDVGVVAPEVSAPEASAPDDSVPDEQTPTDRMRAVGHDQPTPEPVRPTPVKTPHPGGVPHADRPAADAAVPQFESIALGPRAAEDLEAADDDRPAPLPIISDRRDVPASSTAPSQVRGVFCKNHHFNDPRQLFCAVCGINMVQQTPVLVDGNRPPLGVIVLDDGSVFQLDTSYLLGRDPDSDDLVRRGRYRSIPMADNQNLISRIHARLELRSWDVVLVDNASTNGTFFARPGSPQWERVPTSGEQLLVPGSRIRIGNRTLAFNSHRGS